MADFLPYGAQSIDDDDIAAVVDALRSPYLTTGPRVGEFEQALARRVDAAHGIAVSSGTAGLHAAVHALDLAPGDEVIVPAITFLATANAVRYVGARPVFSDVCPDCGLMRPEDLEVAITPRTKAVIPVHLTGQPVDLAAIRRIADAHGLTVIEDAAHAVGASTDDGPIGNCAHSSMAIFSFHPVKHITTGEGGMVMTNDAALAHRLRRFISHGMERQAEHLERESEGPWYYEQQELGFNYRITDVQCALGTSQLKKLDQFVDRRRELAAIYDAAFAQKDAIEPNDPGPDGSVSSYHLYQVLIDFEAIGKTRAQVVNELRERGIGTQVHYIPVPSQPDFRRAGYGMDGLPGAARFYARTLSLPLFPRMSSDDVARVVRALDEVVKSVPALG